MKRSLIEIIEILSSKTALLEEEIRMEQGANELTFKQIIYLEQINKMHNPTASELAKHFDITKPSVTGILSRLEDKGYISTVKSDSDRRVSHIHLTAKGSKIDMIHQKAHKKLATYLTKKLNATEKERLLELLNKAMA